MLAELLTRWTIRAALALYVVFLAGRLGFLTGRLGAARGGGWRRLERPLWTLACLCFLAHLVAAMHFYHGWSNTAAVLDTAEQTEQLLGYRFGEGIYFSYLFALIWAVDVAWWWIAPAGYERRHPGLATAIHAYLFFIAFNGAIVFEAGVTRWLGVPAVLLLGLLAARRLTLRPPFADPTPNSNIRPTSQSTDAS